MRLFKFLNMIFHLTCYETVFNQFFSYNWIKRFERNFSPSNFCLKNRNIFKVNNIDVLLLLLRLMIFNTNLFSDDSCRLCSSSLLSFDSAFIFCPFIHFILYHFIFHFLLNHFMLFLKYFMNSSSIINSIISWKLFPMLNIDLMFWFKFIYNLLWFIFL